MVVFVVNRLYFKTIIKELLYLIKMFTSYTQLDTWEHTLTGCCNVA
jgi:hypothetical protein